MIPPAGPAPARPRHADSLKTGQDDARSHDSEPDPRSRNAALTPRARTNAIEHQIDLRMPERRMTGPDSLERR